MVENSIGPTGEYPFGKPLIDGDTGSLNAQLLVSKDDNVIALKFGKGIGGFGQTRQEACDMIGRIRSVILQQFGDLDPSAARSEPFPIRFQNIETEFGPRVMLWMPTVTEIIVGTPVFWLVYCELLEAAAAKAIVH